MLDLPPKPLDWGSEQQLSLLAIFEAVEVAVLAIFLVWGFCACYDGRRLDVGC